MPYCNGCGGVFEWGFHDGKWVLLEPVASHDDLDRTYVDENGVLRADHRDRHPRGETVNVERLGQKVKAEDVRGSVDPDDDDVFLSADEPGPHASILARIVKR